MNWEDVEWQNYWIENNNIYSLKKPEKKLLLIGDSVTRQYREHLNCVLSEANIGVDLLATSATVLDKRLYLELRSFMEEYHIVYDYIVFNLGAHHGYWFSCENDNVKERYVNSLLNLFDYLEDFGKEIVVASSTPEREDCVERMEHNIEVRCRNMISYEISCQRGYKYVDLFSLVNIERFQFTDEVHFVEKASESFAMMIAKAIGISIRITRNYVYSLEQFIDSIHNNCDKEIFIYGGGTRGKRIKSFLDTFFGSEIKQITYKDVGFIVSDEKYQPDMQAKRISTINPKESYILVSIEDNEVWSRLNEEKYCFCTISTSLLRKFDVFAEINYFLSKSVG